MTKLYNLTSHEQGRFLDKFRELGFEIVNPSPQVRAVEPSFEAQVAEGIRAASGIPEGSCVLIGGAQIIVESIIKELAPKGCRFYTALSERKTGTNGEFIFELKEVSETLFSKMKQKGGIPRLAGGEPPLLQKGELKIK